MQISSWKTWSEQLWKVAENEWISRNGQDHFYRINVVIPSLKREISKVPNLQSVIDLGCGDAYILYRLIERKIIAVNNIKDIVLIDRSGRFLKEAKSRMQVPSVQVIKADLDNETWVPPVKRTKPNRLFLSIFLIQEMPRLDRFILNLHEVFGQNDLGLFITVAPFFANLLVSTGKMHQERKSSTNSYFRWAASYPISNNSRTIYLPYFHRTKKEYEEVLNRYQMKVENHKYLSVPDSKAARNIFKNTLYGKDIINKHSSLLLIVKKK